MDECIKILEKEEAGVLAVIGDGGYPYTVPMNYIYSDGKIYFHTAKGGHKNDAIAENSKVSFCVIEESEVDTSVISSRSLPSQVIRNRIWS